MLGYDELLAAQRLLCYVFGDLSLLAAALTAADSNSPDREGHRHMAQVGNALMRFVILIEGYARGLSREQQEEAVSNLLCKSECSKLARTHGLDRLVKCSPRQDYLGPQPTTLKNTIAALIGAVWLDSFSYQKVTQVMVALGLVNYVGPMSYTESVSTETIFPLTSTQYGDAIASSSTTESMPVQPMSESFANQQGWSSGLYSPPTDGNDPQSLQNFFSGLHLPNEMLQTPGLSNLANTGSENFVEVEHTATVLSPAATQSSIDPLPGIMDRATLESSNASISGVTDEAGSSKANTSEKEAQTRGPKSSKRKFTGTQTYRVKNNELSFAFRHYLMHEESKLKQIPDRFKNNYGHMQEYEAALSSIDRIYQHAAGVIAIGIGDSSAICSLRQAIESLRSPSASGMVRVRRSMAPEDRIGVILGLDVRMSHLRMLQWLHIYKLFEETLEQVPTKEVDGFVNFTTEDVRSGAGALSKGSRGNPRNLEQAGIGQLLSQRMGASSLKQTRSKAVGRRLRLMGRRLHQLVFRFELGILAILGPDITEQTLMSLSKTAFENLIETIERFEGPSILKLSTAALPAVHLFMDEHEAVSKLKIEEVGESDLVRLPRQSQEMRDLFSPSS